MNAITAAFRVFEFVQSLGQAVLPARDIDRSDLDYRFVQTYSPAVEPNNEDTTGNHPSFGFECPKCRNRHNKQQL